MPTRARKRLNKNSGAGRFRLWLSFEVLTGAKNSYREVVETWTESFGTWGSMQAKPGMEWPNLGQRIAGEKRQAESFALFQIPWTETVIDPARYRIVWGGKTWDIHSVYAMPDGRPFEYHIEASSIT